MTQKGYEVLRTFLNIDTSLISFVVCAHDSSLDNDYYDEIESLCYNKKIKFYDRLSLEKDLSTISIAVSWRWMIKSNHPIIVFHDSLLPKYRGFNPLPSALINGESEIGVTSLYATDEYDKGEIILSSSSKITYPITLSKSIKIIINNYIDLTKKIVNILLSGRIPYSTPQLESEATYSLWRDDKDYLIDWNQSSKRIRRHVDSLGKPYKGASSHLIYKSDVSLVRILSVQEVDDVIIENRNNSIGKVIFIKDGKPVVVCGDGLLYINDMVDDSGKNALPIKNFRSRFS